MAGFTAQGATFTFNNVRATVVSVQVEEPTAEVVDMTGMFDNTGHQILVPTGAFSGGTVTVEFIGQATPATIGTIGPLSFANSTGVNLTRRCILENASIEARTGDLVRGTMKFRLTDYLP
jgi:hypothetical protein